ncbi:hypothetical protein [Halalkalibacter krulwichiae]|uniref:hypothetical protein n=1 Tax=Halalkalibacter krulwichiae TaxID=199441 RepID=UPI0012ECBE01|nr:hypothetical protein [Halalkalibacter krulwichiae]
MTPIEERELYAGEWSFEIPVKKHPAIVKELDVETEVAGNLLRFTELTIAPTITKLTYEYTNRDQHESVLQYLISGIEGDGKTYEVDPFSMGGGISSAGGFRSQELLFESIFLDEPDVLKVEIDGAVLEVFDEASFPYDFEQEETFEYLGTTLSFENIDLGNPTTFTLKEDLGSNREFESLNITYVNGNDQSWYGSYSNGTGTLVDASGEVYDVAEYFFRMHELKQPRIYTTESFVTIEAEDKVEMVQPTGFEINGYTKRKFFDQSIEIDLK